MSQELMHDFEKECRDAVKWMTFFGDPVETMTAQQMVVVVGYLRREQLRLEKERDSSLRFLRVPKEGTT
jgi:hypothetical protein